jgi:hypothetical protein
MSDHDPMTDEKYIADAEKARSSPVYVCFEEPSDPLVWTAKDPKDPTWGGQAERPGTGTEPGDFPSYMCQEQHPILGCGWYWLVPEVAAERL